MFQLLFVDWRCIAFLVLVLLILAVLVPLVIQNVELRRENQMLKRRIWELEHPNTSKWGL